MKKGILKDPLTAKKEKAVKNIMQVRLSVEENKAVESITLPSAEVRERERGRLREREFSHAAIEL